MEPGHRFTATVESISSDGSGVARAGGVAVFLDMTAPGDQVAARVTETHRGWAKAAVEAIETPSPLRVPPACPSYGVCGGCSLQHLDYRAQLAAKRDILKDAFLRTGGFGPAELPAIGVFPSPPWEYRNRVRLHPRRNAPPGFKGKKSGETVPLADCPVADPGIRRFLGEAAAGALPDIPEGKSIALYSRGGVLLVEGTGRSRGSVTLSGRTISLDAGLFFQANAGMQEPLIGGVLEAAERTPGAARAADLYSGVGVFALFLGDRFGRLSLAEENPAALALAGENLAGTDAGLFAGSVESWAAGRLREGAWDFIVADPPRGGLGRRTAELLAAKGPPVLACVSCNPATLARDSSLLKGAYTLETLSLYDFYPQTAHIESLAVFMRNPHE